jgi:MoaA/NifB/PqqE/SkfB family radical SAM enzyme
MWDNACDDCPHVVSNNEIYDHLDGVRELPKDYGLSLYLESFKSDDFTLAPISFSFEIINACDQRCNFCWNWSYDMLDNIGTPKDWKDWAKEKMSFKMFKDTVDDLIELGSPVPFSSGRGGCEDILICGGGEPFLHSRIMDMISHVKNNNFYCQVTTNFSNSVTEERIDELIELQTNQLIINTSAGTEETYCKTRKVKKSAWDKLLHNLNYISNKKEEVGSVNPEVITKFILTRTNVHEIGEMIDLAIKTKADTITFKRFLINDVYNGENLTITDEQYNKFRPILEDKMEHYGFEEIVDFNGMFNFNYVSKKYNVTLRSDIPGFFNKI